MLTSLTTQQEKLLETVVTEWIDCCDAIGKNIDLRKLNEAVKYLYAKAGLGLPEVIVADSPLAAVLIDVVVNQEELLINSNHIGNGIGNSIRRSVDTNIFNKALWGSVSSRVDDSVRNKVTLVTWNSIWNSVSNSVGNGVWGSIGSRVDNKVWNSIWNSINNSIWNSVWNKVNNDSVWDSVWNRVNARVRDSVSNKVWNSIWNSVGDLAKKFSWIGCWDYGWAAFYDYFIKIGIVEHKEFCEYRDKIIKSGMWSAISYKNICIPIKMPTNVCRNRQRQLHSTTGYAVTFADGYGQHYLSNVFFPKNLYERLISGNMGVPNILKIKNTEQRMAALSFIGAEKLLQQCNAELVDSSDRGNKLYKIPNLDGMTVYLVRFICPSTGREYVHFIDFENWIKCKERQADQAVARMFDWTLDQYDSLGWEA